MIALVDCIAKMSEEVEVTVKWQGDEYSLNMSQDQTVGDMKRRLAGVMDSSGKFCCHFRQLSACFACAQQLELLVGSTH